MKKKIALGLVALVAVVGGVAGMSAFEAHVINVTAKIENALRVDTTPIDFGTVFPQEELDKKLDVTLSASFLEEDRVDDVEYMIRQKPKCGITTDDGQTLVGPTATGHVVVGDNPATQGVVEKSYIDCGREPRPLVTGETWGVLPLLCPYLSKHEITRDGTETDNDEGIDAFHQPWVVDGDGNIDWTEALGRLSKIAGDTLDTWNLDLKVPCFGDHCAQDWADFVDDNDGDNEAKPDDYIQPFANEHKIFGCDLWIEVLGVSLAKPCVPGTFTVVSDTTNTVQGGGNAEALSFLHAEWTASIPGATWIWKNNPVQTPGADETYTFVKQFNVSGASVTTASLQIASDNTYSVKVNGAPPVCSSADEDNFHLATQDVCNVTNLVAGANTLEITVKNIGIPGSTPTTNPAGLLYKLTYTTVCETLGCGAKADLMLVLDRSGSVGEEMTALKDAAKGFVDSLAPTAAGAHVGMVSFSNSATTDAHLTDDGTAVKAAIDLLVSAGLTNLEDALLDAAAELANPGDGHDRTDVDSPDYIVLITDGAPTESNTGGDHAANATAAATAAKAAGATIYVVGVGTTTGTSDYLKASIATSAAHYFDAADFVALKAILDALVDCPTPV